MQAGYYEGFVIEQGATFSEPLKYQDGDGNTIDLTGYTGRMKVKYPDGTELLALTTENGRMTIVGGTTPDLENIKLLLLASITNDLAAGDYNFDIELVAPDAVTVYRILQGPIPVSPQITT